jgi:hypothetical protein
VDTEKESLRAQVRRLEAKVAEIEAEVAAMRGAMREAGPSIDPPRPTETFALWNNRLNAGT